MAEQKTIGSFESFKAHVDGIAADIERRRQSFLTRFKFDAVLAFLLVAGLPWYVRPALEGLAYVFSMLFGLASDWKDDQVGSDEVFAFAALIVLFAIWLLIWPIFSYRGRNQGAGFTPRTYSLKDEIYSKICTFLGNF